MDAILKGTDEKSQYENKGNHEHEFTKGNASDALPEIVKLDLERNEGDGLINDGVEENKGDGEGDEVVEVAGEGDGDDEGEGDGDGDGDGEADGDGVGEDDGEGNGDVEDAGEGDGEDDATDMEGNDADDEGHVPPRRKRKPSERIILEKLMKPFF
ncbi:uncharacterized protein LOC111900333 [Lactuca sativa]|uniref:uncharacterized protein LOC111900333 n=1 Tax=Lactuca sativa TaxID=4236 RepID=UPI000CD9A3BE|nr:uncharacterized protein LOC111900333 [Lactuca sativa]